MAWLVAVAARRVGNWIAARRLSTKRRSRLDFAMFSDNAMRKNERQSEIARYDFAVFVRPLLAGSVVWPNYALLRCYTLLGVFFWRCLRTPWWAW